MPVSRAGGGVVGDDERLADQRVEPLEHVDVVGVVDHRAMLGQVEPAGEHRGVAQQLALVVGQQIVGPAHCVLQRLLPLGLRAPMPRSSRKRSPSRSLHLDRAHGGHPRRRQLDAQREPVEGLADLGHGGRGLRVVQAEAGPDRTGSLDEQLDRVGGDAPVERQRRHGQQRLAGDPEVLARRGQDLGVSGPTEDLSDGRACGVEHVLAVVDHQQEPSAGNASATVSISSASPCGVMPSAVAMAAGTDEGSPTGASSTSQTPSGNSSAISAPTSRASRVLPTPPDATQA